MSREFLFLTKGYIYIDTEKDFLKANSHRTKTETKATLFFDVCRIFTARKRSLGQGNMFTPVCHSVHRGGCLLRGGGVPALRGTGYACSGGGGACSRGVPGGDPPDGHCCRRYASYWNALLSLITFPLVPCKETSRTHQKAKSLSPLFWLIVNERLGNLLSPA